MKRRAHLRRVWRAVVCLALMTLWIVDPRAFAATGFTGKVTFNGLPVPGAIVTATQGDKKQVAITDQQGAYAFGDIADGSWTFQVEMSGFATQTQDVTVAAGTAAPTWELKLMTLAEITHGAPPVKAESEPAAPAASATSDAAAAAVSSTGTSTTASTGAATGNSSASSTAKSSAPRPAANSANSPPPPAAAQAQPADSNTGSNEASSDLQQSAATGLVVNGSVNNGAASPFAQTAAFGNNRRGAGLLYNGNFGVNFDTSVWDARNYSQVSGLAKPGYNQVSLLGNVGGPIGIPHHYLSNSNFTVLYQHGANDTATTVLGIVPTLLEREGNLSQTLGANRMPVQVYNPATNMPYSGSMVPVSPQAQTLLNEYPMPNLTNGAGFNYETPGLTTGHTDALQVRLAKNKNRNQFNGQLGYQHQAGQQNANIFGFQDGSNSSGVDGTVSWGRTFRPGGVGYFTTLFQYEYNRLASSASPFFANRTNLSGAAGIQGNDQDPDYWGPPNLIFGVSGEQGLSDGAFSRSANDTQTITYKSLWYRGKHSVQFGGDLLRLQFNSHSEQNGRGTFTFNGDATQEISGGLPVANTGSDLADFLLGIPDNASIGLGNADKYLRGWREDAFITDDFRMKAGLTVNVGVRWEFSSPLTEIKDRLANLDVAPGFTRAVPVTAVDPMGSITGRNYSHSLLNDDYRGIEPRLAIAWRPRSNSPLVVRAGYGIYDMTSVYQVIASQMSQQPPFSRAFNLTNSEATPLTMATAFTYNPPLGLPTFGVDPNFRIGNAQIWNASVQQDLPGSLVMTATYTGTKGTRLMQEYLPNTLPLDAVSTCLTCPAGFIYLSSNADSTREAGSIQLRRRLRDGLTATVQYTYAKAIDDASAFSGASIGSGGAAASSAPSSSSSGGASLAQNWQDLRAERAPSTFDQRNLLTFSAQFTTGEGLRAGALMSGWRGTLFKDWTFLTSINVGSGLPFTPIYQTGATGISGVLQTFRPNRTSESVTSAPVGTHVNPAAFAAPTPGAWGNAGRDSIVGPMQFGMNASFSRTFRLNSRMDATWETQATNVLNTPVAAGWNSDWSNGSAFGTTTSWNTMRKLSTTIRVRF
jgi:hypothetical protein